MSKKPIQYIKGFVEFYKLKFKVTPDVLIPRPESELLVDEVLNYLKTNNQQQTTIIDVGTGSGNIAISIAKQLPTFGLSSQIIATDISKGALKIAKLNAKFHKVDDRIKFLHSDLLIPIGNKPSRVHIGSVKLENIKGYYLIVANLPYIPTQRIPYLDCSVKDFEPIVALDGGEDGFGLYRKLFKQILDLQKSDKNWNNLKLICEIDYTHGQLAANESLKFFPKARVEIKLDLAHKQRILVIKF